MKKTIIMFLIVTMFASFTTLGYAQQELFKEDIFTYTVSNDEITITNVDDVCETVIIPEEIDSKPVTALGIGALGGSHTIKTVDIPKTVKTLGHTCFAYSTSIRTVNLSYGLEKIEDGAFLKCTELWTITIPDTVKEIGDGAFNLCSNLSAATIPSSVKNIGEDAFVPAGGFKIYAKPNSVGEKFAKENSINYEELISVNVNGEDVVFDQPCITDKENFATLVPMRAVMEALGAKVSWNSVTNNSSIAIDGNRIVIYPNNNYMLINNKEINLTTPAIEFNSRLLLPIRKVIESIGGKVNWNEETKTVTITYKKGLLQ